MYRNKPTNMEKLLLQYFNLKSFKVGQKEIIGSILRGKDVFAVMPTGSGKSLCYQFPAILQEGLTVVISPLIALMNSQVEYLKKLGIPCGALTSNTNAQDLDEIRVKLKEQTLKILYMAPERLSKISTAKLLKDGNTRLIIVDEAHCVSQWGHDFRPNYLLICNLRKSLNVPLAAFTATADARTKEDIMNHLFSNKIPKTFYFGCDRPNLFLSFELKDSPRNQILNYVFDNKDQNGIIYCSTRAKVESIAQAINDNGFKALAYHAGLEKDIRHNVEKLFRSNDNLIIVATIAFGMGLDKSNVRWVAHADLPQTIEGYYQEIGRAGRDSKPAKTLTLYSYEDIEYRRDQIDEGTDSCDQRKLKHQKLNYIIGLADEVLCRRQNLLNYFGEKIKPCGNCDICRNPKDTFNATKYVRKVLKTIVQTEQKLSLFQIINILFKKPLKDKIIYSDGEKSSVNSLKVLSETQWLSVFRQMMGKDFIRSSSVTSGTITITKKGNEFLNSNEQVDFNIDLFFKKVPKIKIRKLVKEEDQALFLRLKAFRKRLAETNYIPNYFIFNDSTLIEITEKKPKDLDTLIKVHGIGPKKLKQFGEPLLKIINSDIPIHVHPARKLLAGKVFASIYDKLIEAQNKLAQGTDGYEKKITCSPSLVSRISKLNNPTQEHINIVLGKKRATRFGKAFFKILKNHQ